MTMLLGMATRVLNKKGLTYTTRGKSGTLIRQRLEIRMREAARGAYQTALSELGASPVASTRLHRLPSSKPYKKRGIEEFFTRRT